MDMNEALSDYREAQAAGHHVDCDGYMTSHRVEIVPTFRNCFKAVCEDCGELHVGSFGSKSDAIGFQAGHSSEAKCDGRCREWATSDPRPDPRTHPEFWTE